MEKKDTHRFIAEAWGYDTWTDEDGVVHSLEEGLEEIPLEEFTPFEEEGFIYFQDENVRRYSEENLSSRYNNRGIAPEDDGGGSVIVRAPTKLSWSALATISVVAVNLLVAGMAFYFTQKSFNSNVENQIAELEANQKTLAENIYTKQEYDLKYENIQLAISRNDDAIKRLQNKVGD